VLGGGVPRRILVVKLADLGDLLTATPALRALRTTFPTARIEALVTPGSSSLLAGSDAVDELIPFDKFSFDRPIGAVAALPAALSLGARLRRRRYDFLVLLHHLTTRFGTTKYAALALASGAGERIGLDNGRGWFLTRGFPDHGFGERHEVDYWLGVVGLLGAANSSPRLEIVIPEAAQAAAGRRWTGLRLGGRAAILHPGSGAFSLARRWPTERYAALADRLVDELGLEVAVLAGPAPGEPELASRVAGAMRSRAVVVEGIESFQELAGTLKLAELFIGNDSGVMHLAAAVETPVVAIFGPSNHRAWGPYPPNSPRHAVVREPLACSPCFHRGHRFGTPQGCPARTCLDLVGVDMVLEAAARVQGAGGRVKFSRLATCHTPNSSPFTLHPAP
jgi:heptosyltransferase-2